MDMRRTARQAHPGPYRFEILGTDTDEGDALHGSSLFSFMQESAYRNAEHLGIGASQLDGRGLCWLLLKISVRLDRLPAWDDILEVHTWSRGVQRLLFLRDFRFRVEGEPGFFGAASSEWLVGQAGTHRPQRPETVFSGLASPVVRVPDGEPGVLPFACPRLPAIPDAVPDVLRKFADYSDIDRNRHVNNTRYVAWAVDALHAGPPSENSTGGPSEDFTGGPAENSTGGPAGNSDSAPSGNAGGLPDGGWRPALRGIDINYLSEVRPGEQIRLKRLAVEPGQAGGLPEAAVVPGTAAMLVEGRRHPDGTPVFRCLLQYAQVPTA